MRPHPLQSPAAAAAPADAPPASALPAWLARAYTPLLLLYCFLTAWQPLKGGDDVWAHAAVGRWIWQHQGVPRQTLFLWGAMPIPWIAHSWLSQLWFYALLRLGGKAVGPYLIQLFTVGVVAATYLMLWRRWARRAGINLLMPLIFTLAIMCGVPRYHPRPELFTALFLTWLLCGLIDYSAQGRGIRPILLLPLLFVLWANFHGAVAIGLVLLLTTVVCELPQERGSPRWWQLLAIAALCVLAMFATPYGARYWGALRPIDSKTFASIDEWKPFWKTPRLPVTFVLAETVLAVGALWSWWLNPHRRWAQALWVVVMFGAFISERRHLWLLALTCLAVMGANAGPSPRSPLGTGYWVALWRRRRSGMAAAGLYGPVPEKLRVMSRLVVVEGLFIFILFFTPSDFLPLHAVAAQIPAPSCRYIARNLRPRRLFNDYENSSYLEWEFGGHPPLFVDLLNAYPDRLLQDYFTILKVGPAGRRMLGADKIDCVVLRRHGVKDAVTPLSKFLDSHAPWRRVYIGKDATIWINSTLLPSAGTPTRQAIAR